MRFARGRTLDLGCGAGRVALHLQDRGVEVVAIDLSPGAVAVSRERGVRDVRLLGLSDVKELVIGTFDTVCMFGNNFGLLEREERVRPLLAQLAVATPSHGRILAESLDPYDTADERHRAYQERNRAAGRLGGQARLRVRHGHYATDWFDWLFVSPDEMQELVRDTNWGVTHILTDGGPGYIAVLDKQ